MSKDPARAKWGKDPASAAADAEARPEEDKLKKPK